MLCFHSGKYSFSAFAGRAAAQPRTAHLGPCPREGPCPRGGSGARAHVVAPEAHAHEWDVHGFALRLRGDRLARVRPEGDIYICARLYASVHVFTNLYTIVRKK